LQNLFVVLFTSRSKPFPHPKLLDRVLHYGEVALPVVTLAIVVVSAIFFLILSYIVTKTKMGRAMRAVSKDLEAAELMGVDSDRVIAFSFILSTAFAAVGAFMYCSKFPYVDPFTGVIPGLKAFIAAVMGGIGSIPGALVGGFILGLGEIMLVAFMPSLTSYRDIFAYLILILFLLFRPGGIFNVKVREEKV
jgi:branched-chain amino acid transport system permease protein